MPGSAAGEEVDDDVAVGAAVVAPVSSLLSDPQATVDAAKATVNAIERTHRRVRRVTESADVIV